MFPNYLNALLKYLKFQLFLIVYLCLINVSNSGAPWYEDLPAVAMDYKVHVDPGKEDCYFQYVHPKASLYVSYQVLRGGDGMCGFAVRNPQNEIVQPYQWKANGEYQEQQSLGGYYSICIDNQFSRFADKLVNLYITVIRYEEWDKYAKELEEMNLNIENFTTTVTSLEKNLNDIEQYQHLSRSKENKDYNLILDNFKYVQMWSIIQIVVILITGSLQVYFVRNLFETKSTKSSGLKSKLTNFSF